MSDAELIQLIRRMMGARVMMRLTTLHDQKFRGRLTIDIVDGVVVCVETTSKEFFDKRADVTKQ
jgi:hypothetical protein